MPGNTVRYKKKMTNAVVELRKGYYGRSKENPQGSLRGGVGKNDEMQVNINKYSKVSS